MAALQDGETCSRHPLPSLLYAAQLSCVSGRATSSRTAAPSAVCVPASMTSGGGHSRDSSFAGRAGRMMPH